MDFHHASLHSPPLSPKPSNQTSASSKRTPFCRATVVDFPIPDADSKFYLRYALNWGVRKGVDQFFQNSPIFKTKAYAEEIESVIERRCIPFLETKLAEEEAREFEKENAGELSRRRFGGKEEVNASLQLVGRGRGGRSRMGRVGLDGIRRTRRGRTFRSELPLLRWEERGGRGRGRLRSRSRSRMPSSRWISTS